MPESPLVQIETTSLNDLEALIAKRAKDETETETGFRRRIEWEEKEYQTSSQQLAVKFKVDLEAMEAEYARRRQEILQIYQRDTQACDAEYLQTKQQVDDQFKKDQRRGKKIKDEAGWQALAVFEGTRDDGIKWRRATEASWSDAIEELDIRQSQATLLLKRCGSLASGTAEEEAAACAGSVPAASPTVGEPSNGGDTPDEVSNQPAEDNPLSHLRTGLAHIEQELLALDALRIPKLLQIQV